MQRLARTHVKDCKAKRRKNQSWETNVKLRIARQRGHSSPALQDKCKGLQGRGGHSSPEVGDKCKGLQGRGGHRQGDK